MKIYIFEESINKMGGVERIISFIAKHFNEIGKSVTVVSMYKDGKKTFFDYDDKIERVYLCDEKVPQGKLRKKMKYISLIKNKIKICKKIKSDDVVIFGRVSVAVKFLPYINSNTKTIVRDAINLYNQSSIVRKLMKHYFPKKVNKFIVSSQESINNYNDFFGNIHINMSKIYNPLAINVDNCTKYNFDNNTIISVGRFDSQKGFENLIKAFKIVNKKHNNWKLKIVGNGELRKTYEKLIKDLNLSDFIDLVPSSKNIETEYIKASIFVMTSRYEGYANALVEALACGLPSISYNWLTGVDDIVNKKNGIIVDLKDRVSYFKGIDNSEDIINMADAMNYLIEHKTICDKMSKEAKKIIETRNSTYILKLWEELIDE